MQALKELDEKKDFSALSTLVYAFPNMHLILVFCMCVFDCCKQSLEWLCDEKSYIFFSFFIAIR